MGQSRKRPRCRFASSARLFTGLIAFLLVAGPLLAAPAGEVTHVSGALVVRKADGASKILAPKSKVDSGDLLATAADTYARVKFADGGEITLRPNSQFKIEMFNYDKSAPAKDSAVFSLLKGGFRTITGVVGKRKPNSYEMRTTVATIGIRGTNYGAQLCLENVSSCENLRNNEGKVPSNGLHLDVSEGGVNVTNAGGTRPLGVGEFGHVLDGRTAMNKVPPGQGVTNNMPGFGTNSSDSKAECVVQ
jgi:hypothetical protein